MSDQVDQILNEVGVAQIPQSERPLMSYNQAKAERLNAIAQAFWDQYPDSVMDRWQIRRDNPEAPADSYVVHLGFLGTHETPEGVYLTNPCVLAGDGRARNEDGTLHVVPAQELEAVQWSVRENNWSEW
jgi:hypothetical protein